MQEVSFFRKTTGDRNFNTYILLNNHSRIQRRNGWEKLSYLLNVAWTASQLLFVETGIFHHCEQLLKDISNLDQKCYSWKTSNKATTVTGRIKTKCKSKQKWRKVQPKESTNVQKWIWETAEDILGMSWNNQVRVLVVDLFFIKLTIGLWNITLKYWGWRNDFEVISSCYCCRRPCTHIHGDTKLSVTSAPYLSSSSDLFGPKLQMWRIAIDTGKTQFYHTIIFKRKRIWKMLHLFLCFNSVVSLHVL